MKPVTTANVSKLIKKAKNDEQLLEGIYNFFDLIERDIKEDRYIQPEIAKAADQLLVSEINRLEEQKKLMIG